MDSTETPLISVIIPVFNRAKLISRTVKSVLEQSLKNLEIVIVDDASTDNTDEVIHKINDPRVRYVRLMQNSGPSAARNIGVQQSTGYFVAFLDSDDEWETRKLELQLDVIRQQTEPDNVVCYTKVRVAQDDGVHLLPSREKYATEPVGDYVLCGAHGLIHTSSLLLSRDLALNNPFPNDQRVFEDWDLFLRLETKGIKWLYTDKPLTTWNAENRNDRLSLTPHDGSLWLEEHKHYLSKKAYNAFLIKGIVTPLIRARRKKLYSQKLLLRAFISNEVPFIEFIRLSTKNFVPPTLTTRLKELVTPRAQG